MNTRQILNVPLLLNSTVPLCQDAAKEVQVDDPCAFRSVPLRQLLQVVRPPEWPFFAPEELPEESAEEVQLIKRFKQICRSAGCIWHSGKKSPESSGSRMGCDAPEARDEPPCGSARGRGVCRCESSSPVGLCDATVVMRECCCERAMTDAQTDSLIHSLHSITHSATQSCSLAQSITDPLIHQVMEAVFGEIHEGYVAHVCEQLNSIEAQSARDLSAEAQSLFDGSRTAKQRDAAGRRYTSSRFHCISRYM